MKIKKPALRPIKFNFNDNISKKNISKKNVKQNKVNNSIIKSYFKGKRKNNPYPYYGKNFIKINVNNNNNNNNLDLK